MSSPLKTRLQQGLLALTGALLLATSTADAREGMWMPANLKAREADMKAAGLEIPVSQIYNTDGTGLNNAVVLFGKGCTGEVISSQGLILTNHHCGYGTVQGLSSREHDYFAAGFWAMNNAGEIPCPGLTVTFIRQMENVTDKITYDLADTLRESRRDSVIAVRVRALEKGYRTATGMDAVIQPFYRGNQYWVIVTETFSDIRLVGFPPNGIGNFGGDTDNWMWPRHNADFSLFRVYAGAGNKPAAYSASNKPYQPKRFFAINTGGYKEGDFTMVYGFPGTTQEYISSGQLDQIYRISDPIRIDARTRKLAVWNKAMEADRNIFLKYTSKRAGIANGWKKWQGEVRGLRLNNVPAKKTEYETGFSAWAALDTTTPYADNLLAQMNAATTASNNALTANEYIQEAVLGIELIQQGAALDRIFAEARRSAGRADFSSRVREAAGYYTDFYKNYDAGLDRQVFTTLMPLFVDKVPAYVPAHFRTMLLVNNGDYARWAGKVYESSLAANGDRFGAFVTGMQPADTVRILSDPAWQLYQAIAAVRAAQVYPQLRQYYTSMERLNRLYMAAQMKKDVNRAFYPDANLTLRLTYGRIKGIDPDGPAPYSFQTYVDEVIAKDQPDVTEFQVPAKLKELVAAKDYGRWSINKKSTVPVAFIADNHTSGGNSGSPVLNKRGELIGTNFDRIWEGTMSDLYFDPNLCRNISVDVRYTLFIIEKFGGAGWLLKEMKLVKG